MGQFSADLSAYAKRIGRSLADTHKAIVIELFTSTVMDTPVLTGQLRGNWRISEGSPDLSTHLVSDPTGGMVAGEIKNFDIKLGGVIYLSNSLPYAYRIEYEGWSHTKAPYGMMRKNFARVQGIVARAARRNR